MELVAHHHADSSATRTNIAQINKSLIRSILHPSNDYLALFSVVWQVYSIAKLFMNAFSIPEYVLGRTRTYAGLGFYILAYLVSLSMHRRRQHAGCWNSLWESIKFSFKPGRLWVLYRTRSELREIIKSAGYVVDGCLEEVAKYKALELKSGIYDCVNSFVNEVPMCLADIYFLLQTNGHDLILNIGFLGALNLAVQVILPLAEAVYTIASTLSVKAQLLEIRNFLGHNQALDDVVV